MKKIRSIIYTMALVIIAAGTVYAQEDLVVPLTNPGNPGKLNLSAVNADDITITAHDREDILIVFDSDEDDDDYNYRKNGLRKISTNGVGLEIVEDNNNVTVRTARNSNDMDLEIRVPENFSVNIRITHGDIRITGVTGEHEVSATNGDIEMVSIGGSVVATSTNGDIEVMMTSVTPDTPMSFTSLNGDIEIAFPADTKFTGKMKTDYGEVYTNFDITLDRSANATEMSSDDGKYTVTINKWIQGNVNGGGPEFLFKTFHGDIEISKI